MITYTVEVYNFKSSSLTDWGDKLVGQYEITARTLDSFYNKASRLFPNASRVKIIRQAKAGAR